MKTPSRTESAAIEKAEFLADAVTLAEKNRAAIWDAISPTDRMRAVGVAGLVRGDELRPLSAFTPAERAAVVLGLSVHIARMEVVARCMAQEKTNAFGMLH